MVRSPGPSSTRKRVFRFLRSHPLLVAWLSIIPGLCFATGVAVSLLLDPNASHQLNRTAVTRSLGLGTNPAAPDSPPDAQPNLASGSESGFESAAEGAVVVGGLAARGLAAGATVEADLGGEDAVTADRRRLMETQVAETDVRQLVSQGTSRQGDLSLREPESKPNVDDEFVIIAPAPEFDRRNQPAFSLSDFNWFDRTAEIPSETSSETSGPTDSGATSGATARQTRTQATIALSPDSGDVALTSSSRSAFRLWILGGVGLGCGWGALWVSQRLMAELKVNPAHFTEMLQGAIARVTDSSRSGLRPHPPARPSSPARPHPHPPARSPLPAATRPIVVAAPPSAPTATTPTPPLPASPQLPRQAAPPSAAPSSPPSNPATSTLPASEIAEEVDLRKRRSPSSWF